MIDHSSPVTERDFDKRPYSPDEKRVAEFISERGAGGGDDPIGFILASYAYLVHERNELRAPAQCAPIDAVLAAVSKVVSSRDDLGQTHFEEIRDAILSTVTSTDGLPPIDAGLHTDELIAELQKPAMQVEPSAPTLTDLVDKAAAWDAIAEKNAEIERLRAEVRHLRIDNARLRDEAALSSTDRGEYENHCNR